MPHTISSDQPPTLVAQALRFLATEAADIVATAFDEPRRRAAATLESVAHGIAIAGRDLRAQHHGLAMAVEDGSLWLHRAAHGVRTRPLTDWGMDALTLARRQPVLVAAGAFGVGLVLARLLRADEGAARRRLTIVAGQDMGR